MNNAEERRQRRSLNLIFSGLVFVFLVGTMLVVALMILLLLRRGVLRLGESTMRPGTFILVIGLASIGIGTALSAVAGRYPLRSVNRTINAMNRLAAGDYHTRLHYSGLLRKLPVTKELSDSFNTMAEELENTEMLRSDFINNFSHEFKTPIVSIAGFAKLLKKGNLSPAEQAEYLDIIEAESLRLSAMATNVLNLTRIENQSILSGVTEYNLSEQLRSCVLLLEGKWSRKNLELMLDFREHRIRASEELLQQVWLNLLDNAVKFTPDFGLVQVDIRDEGENLAVAVINSGSRIPPESMERIFQKFYQADESHATEGNGIGLAVVRKIVELHSGRVDVESDGERTAFTVTLPKTQPLG